MKDKALSVVMKALSDETRLRIIHLLYYSSMTVQEITTILKMGQSRVSRHLKILNDSGLLQFHREGSWVYYALTLLNSNQFYKQLFDFLFSNKKEFPYYGIDSVNVSKTLKQREKKSNQYFNEIAGDWENIQKVILDPNLYREKILLSFPENVNATLDIGCGSGEFTGRIQNYSKRVVGIDTSEKMLKEAKIKFNQNKKVTFLNSRIEELESSYNQFFDVVIASMVLHHISNPPNALANMYNLLKEGGIIYLIDLKKHDNEKMRDNFSDLWLGFEKNILLEWIRQAKLHILEYQEIKTISNQFKILFLLLKKEKNNVNSSRKE